MSELFSIGNPPAPVIKQYIVLPLCECGQEVVPGEDNCHFCLHGTQFPDDTQELQSMLDRGMSITSGEWEISGTLTLTCSNTRISGVRITKYTDGPILQWKEGVNNCSIFDCWFMYEKG